jgi:hypothetical protein
LGWPWWSLGVALRWLCTPQYMACRWLWGGFKVALGGFAMLFKARSSRFEVHHEHLEYNSPSAPPSRRSWGALDKPWTCPATLEPPHDPVCDQPSLFRPLSGGIFAAERLKCRADPRSAGGRHQRLCGPCSAKLKLWTALGSFGANRTASTIRRDQLGVRFSERKPGLLRMYARAE